MEKHGLEQVIKNADRAINNEDFDQLMDFYSEDATLVVKPGTFAKGKMKYVGHSLLSLITLIIV